MNVLCVNHTGDVSGAERSLLDLMSGLRNELNVRLACPMTGPLAGAARRLDIPVDRIPDAAGSLKLHPVHTPLALTRMISRRRAHVITRHVWAPMSSMPTRSARACSPLSRCGGLRFGQLCTCGIDSRAYQWPMRLGGGPNT